MVAAAVRQISAETKELHLDAAELLSGALEIDSSATDLNLYLDLRNISATDELRFQLKFAPHTHANIFYRIEKGNPRIASTFILTEGSRLDFFSHLAGSGAHMRVNAEIPQNAEAHFSGLTETAGKEKAAIEVNVHHTAGKNLTWQKFYSYAEGESAISFTGRIAVDPGADGAVAHQLHRGVTLSEGARIDAQPFLNIMHDDVKCTHGSTVGFIDEDALRYLMARGIAPTAAEEILILSSQKQFYEALPHEQAAAFFKYKENTL